MKISAPRYLRCEYLRNPLGIDTLRPRFSWIVEHKSRGQRQKAFQIIVSSGFELALEGIGDQWDSAKVESEQTFNANYSGKPLKSFRQYFWRVRWWDKDGNASPFSETAFFEMGLLKKSDWKAKWVSKKSCKEFSSRGTVFQGKYMGKYIHSQTLYLRKEFEAKEEVQRARAYVCGLGLYEMHLNGKKIGDRVLDPAQTDYKKIALYSTYDITSQIKRKNAIGVLLGNGRHIKNYGYGHPRLILQIMIDYKNGNKETIVSDETWKVSYGALNKDGLYFGERYDARLERPGWDEPGFDDSKWHSAAVVRGPMLYSQMIQPIRVTKRLKAKRLYSPSPGIYIYDFGQNFAGWARLSVAGPRGTEVRLRHAELIHEDGTLNTAPNQNAEATDVYILKGDGLEAYEPRFTYHGFRYVEVSGFPGVPFLENVQGCVVHTDVEKAGEFFCSNELLNKIHHNIIWGQLSNLMSIPTDCSQRDERQGWLGDAHLSAEEAAFNFDMAAFYTKFLKDIQLAQKEDGSLPDTVPLYFGRLYPADPAWGSAYITLAWLVFNFYGDKRILEEHYSSLKKYIKFLRANAEGNILKKLGKYGDWCPPGSVVPKKTPVELTSSWYYYHDVLLLARISKILEKKGDAQRFSKLAEQIKEAFNKNFLEDDHYKAQQMSPVERSLSQTSNTLPLYLDMVPKEKKEKVLQSLVHSITQEQDYHLDTGILGTRYILDVLTDNGYGDVAYRIVNQRSYPGWGYMVEEGATTLWERWEKITGGGMNSHNHIMLGSVDAWFYRVIAGISSLAPGWKRIRIKPPVFDGLDYATATVRTIRGEARLSWQRRKDSFELMALIPVGSEGEIYIPVMNEDCIVREGKRILWRKGVPIKKDRSDASFSGRKGKYLVFKTGSGYYKFNSAKFIYQ
jgi:alpha-L-rhamnosidase